MKKRVEIDTHLENTFMPYAITTIVDRALPDVGDGCKPIHRKILYAMRNKGITHNKDDRAKSTEPVSETMKIHGHGDASIYEALALMTEQNETLLHPFIDGEGAFGKVYSKDNPSASRYTFCRLNKFAEQMFDGIDKGVVDFVEEGGHKQPLSLPATFPNILIKPNTGIAVGEACNFPSFNLVEVCNATKALIDDATADIKSYIYAPDFSTGGEWVKDLKELENVIEVGRGSFKLRSKYLYNEEESCLEVYEIPYSTTADAIIEKVTQIIKSGRNKDILDIRDETGWDDSLDKEKLKIAIDIKKKADPTLVMEYLFKNSPLESAFSVNMNSLHNNVPKVRGIRESVLVWLEIRREQIKKSLQYDLDKYRKEYVLLKGLSIIVSNLDEVIAIVRSSKTDEETISRLIETFKLNEVQANYIADIKLRNLNKDFINKKTSRLDEVIKIGKELSDTISDDNKINDVIKAQLDKVVKEYGKSRLTTIVLPTEVVSLPKEEEVENYNCHIMISKENYIKKYLREVPVENHKVKDSDYVVLMTPTTNRSVIACFTDKGNMYRLKINDITNTQPSALGQYLPAMLPIDKDENIIYNVIIPTDNVGWFIIGFENGKVAKIPVASYVTTRTKLQNVYNQNSKLVSINLISEDETFVCKSFNGKQYKVLLFNTSKVSEKLSRASQGVSTMRLSDGFSMVSLSPLEEFISNKNINTIELENIINYYSTKNINAVGNLLRKTEEDLF